MKPFPTISAKTSLRKTQKPGTIPFGQRHLSQTFSSKDFADPQVQDDKRVAKMAEEVRAL